jgi:hypothetical protein
MPASRSCLHNTLSLKCIIRHTVKGEYTINSNWVGINYQVLTVTQWKQQEREPRNTCTADHSTVKLRANLRRISYNQNGYTGQRILKHREKRFRSTFCFRRLLHSLHRDHHPCLKMALNRCWMLARIPEPVLRATTV